MQAYADKKLKEYKENVCKQIDEYKYNNPYGSYYDGMESAIQIIKETEI